MDVGLRLAELKDKCLLYRWVNSKDSLGIKIKTDKKISFSNHEIWFEERLKDNNTFIWIIEENKNKPIGQIRFQYSKEKYFDIDIYIINKFRKLGIASIELKNAENISNVKPLRATVRKNNYSSYLFFNRNGYRLIFEDQESWVLVKY
ncbi:GNAT family N-acetyltransferase [Alphaproteobacteria bacterium]|nr:GNAT family N-acetyltransferase [Alphaproteobacteria bacterium]